MCRASRKHNTQQSTPHSVLATNKAVAVGGPVCLYPTPKGRLRVCIKQQAPCTLR
eukprot:TRINITY_DN6026_c0_g1_i1.p2 TRINITY_DN6026_c0_g1~~TRINITY_DN6026_c0_g1_i1.p2  ORF type:complete len:55 (-),score=17.90 TRINITY_DN6026_c0_g1_i1:5-169(-)